MSNLARKITRQAKRQVEFRITVSRLNDGGTHVVVDPIDTPLPDVANELMHAIIGVSKGIGTGEPKELGEWLRHYADFIEKHGQTMSGNTLLSPDIPKNPEDSAPFPPKDILQ